MQIPDGSFAIVFETGAFRFDDAGTLYVHLSHGPDTPHPLKTHPEGRTGTIPTEVSSAAIAGTGEGPYTGMAGGIDELPKGFVLEIKGFSICRVESSGDLSVLVPNATAWPDWFTPGKIHRFDGPDGRPALWSQSAEPPKPPAPTKPVKRLEPKATEEAAKGCLPMLVSAIFTGVVSSLFS